MNDSCVEQLRIPPHAIDAEQNVLGGLMLSNAALPKVCDWLAEEDFYRRDHQLIYRAILELAQRDKPFDAVTLVEWFDSQGLPDLVDGGAYLIDLAKTVYSVANIEAYAEIVRDKAKLRQLIDFGTEVVNAGFQPAGKAVQDITAEASLRLAEISGPARAATARTVAEVGKAWFNALDRRYNGTDALGLMTPWAGYNALTSGLRGGDLVVVAARPSMGKSAFAINIALAAALAQKRTMLFSLEMSAESIYNRCISSLSSVPMSWLRSPNDTVDEYWTKVTVGVSKMKSAKMVIDDQAGLAWQQVCARAKREHMRDPLSMVIVDHIHIMRTPGKTRADLEIGEISRELKALAKDLNIPVIAVAQLNRNLESRANKRPMLSDLREAGAIEQDADLITFLYRDDYYATQEKRASDYPGFVEVNVAKQREGETGTVWLRNGLGFGRIDDYDGPEPTREKKPKGNFGYMAEDV